MGETETVGGGNRGYGLISGAVSTTGVSDFLLLLPLYDQWQHHPTMLLQLKEIKMQLQGRPEKPSGIFSRRLRKSCRFKKNGLIFVDRFWLRFFLHTYVCNFVDYLLVPTYRCKISHLLTLV